MKTCLIICFVLSLNQVDTLVVEPRISYGIQALEGEIPYQVFMKNGPTTFCNGVIISEDWIVTAGHCLNNPNYYEYTIRAGSTDRTNEESVHYLEEFITHPNYTNPPNDNAINDIALVRVTPSFQFDNITINSIEMFEEDEPTPENVTAIVSGWGMTEKGDPPNELQQTIVPILPKSECNRILKAYNKSLESGMLCTGNEDEYVNSCVGDSGGPLTVENRLVGIVSWGSLICGDSKPYYPAMPGVFSEISYFRNWIRYNTGV